MNSLFLKKNADKRLHAGHVWVYSNEIDTKRSPLKDFQTGEVIKICAADDKVMGIGYINPNTLICARIVSRNPKYDLSVGLLVDRFKTALALRDSLFSSPYYRLIYGDSDGLSGLIVDRFANVVVVQINTAGMEAMKDMIVEALVKALEPCAIVMRNDTANRKLEGLESYVEVAYGELPEEVFVEENETRFVIPVETGQKTGWFYDHRMNRQRMQSYIQGKRVLDLFSYVGGWGVQAAVHGAESVLCVDASQKALEYAQRSADLNEVQDKLQTCQGDVFDILKALRQDQEKFDVVVLDPPAFIKRRKDQRQGELAYRRINQMAMQVLERGGTLISASCSMHLPHQTLIDILNTSSRHIDRQLQVLEQGHQGPDHPIHPAIPETAYLKSFICRVSGN